MNDRSDVGPTNTTRLYLLLHGHKMYRFFVPFFEFNALYVVIYDMSFCSDVGPTNTWFVPSCTVVQASPHREH